MKYLAIFLVFITGYLYSGGYVTDGYLMSTPMEELSKEDQKAKVKLLKKECEELGFKKDSKKFKECVMDLMK